MPGLYDKASEYARNDMRSAVARTPSDLSELSEDDRRDLNGEIHDLFTNRLGSAWLGQKKTRKRGVGLPIAVNGIIVLLLSVGYISVATTSPAEKGTVGARTAFGDTESAVVSAMRSESEEAITERERQIAAIQSELQTIRREAASEQSNAVADPPEREQELLARLSDLKLEQEMAISGQVIENLGASRDQENFIVTELSGVYGQISEAILSGSVQESTRLLQAAEQIQLRMNDLDGLSHGIAGAVVSMNLVARTAIQALAVDEIQATTGRVIALVEQGDSRFSEGEYVAAERIYRSAMGSWDVLDRAYARLADLNQQRSQAQLEEVRQEQQQVQLQLIQTRKALAEQTRNASQLRTQNGSLEQRVQQLSDTNSRLEEQTEVLAANLRESESVNADLRLALNRMERSLSMLRDQMQSRLTLAETARKYTVGLSEQFGEPITDGNEESVITLIDTKVRLREALDSAEVRRLDATLYDDMERYFDAFGSTKESEGYLRAISDIRSAMRSLNNEIDPTSRPDQAVSDDMKGLFNEVDRLIEILVSQNL